jgi:hypothetical protein
LGSTGIEQAIEHVVKDSDCMSLLDIIEPDQLGVGHRQAQSGILIPVGTTPAQRGHVVAVSDGI